MVQAEQSVIGCLMMAPELLDKARAVLSPAMFEAQPLARIFSCMLELKKAGTPVDAVTVVSRLGDGYEAVIRECACIAPRIGTFPQYAAIVLDAWRERTLVTELQSLAISGRTADEMTAELERMAARQRSIMQKVHSASEQTFGEAVAHEEAKAGGASEMEAALYALAGGLTSSGIEVSGGIEKMADKSGGLGMLQTMYEEGGEEAKQDM